MVFDAELPSPGACLLGTRVGVVARVRLQVVEMERFGARVGQLTTRGPPFDGRLDVSGLVWDRSAAKAVEWSATLASERATLSQVGAHMYVPRVKYPGMSRAGHNMIPGPRIRGNILSLLGATPPALSRSRAF